MLGTAPAPPRPQMSESRKPGSMITRSAAVLRRQPRTLILLLYCCLAFGLFATTWADPFHRLISYLPQSDATAMLWALSWPLWAVAHGQNPLFTTYLNAPAGANLMWTYPPFPGFLMAPVTLVAGPVFSYNLLTTLTLPVSAFVMCLAARRLCGSWGAAAVAGAVYGFGPYAATQSFAHVTLSDAVIFPLLLILGHEAAVRQRWRPGWTGLALGAALSMQVLTFIESAVIAVSATAVAAVVIFLMRPAGWRDRLPYLARSSVIAALTAAALCAVPVGFMLVGAQHLAMGVKDAQGVYVTALDDVFVPSPAQLLSWSHPILTWMGADPIEQNGYLGLPLICILCLTVRRAWNSRVVRVATLVGAVFLILSFGPHAGLRSLDSTRLVEGVFPLPMLLARALPIVGEVLASRLAVVVALCASLLLAVFVDLNRDPARKRSTRLMWGAVALTGLTLLPIMPAPSIALAPVPSFFTSVDIQRIPQGEPVLVAPAVYATNINLTEYWQAASDFRFRLIGGYVFVPAQGGATNLILTPLTSAMTEIYLGSRGASSSAAETSEFRAELASDGVTTVIAGPMPHRSTMLSFLSQLLGRPPVYDRGVYVWWGAP